MFQDSEHIGDVYQDEASQAAMLLYRDKTDDALLMVKTFHKYWTKNVLSCFIVKLCSYLKKTFM